MVCGLLVYGLLIFLKSSANALLIDFNEISNNSAVGSFYEGVNFTTPFIGWALMKSFGCGANPLAYRDIGIRVKSSSASAAILNYEYGFKNYFAFFVTLRSNIPPDASCRVIVLLWVRII